MPKKDKETASPSPAKEKHSRKPAERKHVLPKSESLSGLADDNLCNVTCLLAGQDPVILTCTRKSTLKETIERIHTKLPGLNAKKFELVLLEGDKDTLVLGPTPNTLDSLLQKPTLKVVYRRKKDASSSSEEEVEEESESSSKSSKSSNTSTPVAKSGSKTSKKEGDTPPMRKSDVPFTHKALIDDMETGDVVFDFGKTDPPLAAHSALLAVYNIDFSKTGKGKGPQLVVDATHEKLPAPSLRKILEFIYHGETDLEKLELKALVSLITLSSRFKIKYLQWYATEKFKTSLSLKNIHAAIVIVLKDKLANDLLYSICMEFVRANWINFVADVQGVAKVGIEPFRRIVEDHSRNIEHDYSGTHGPAPPADQYVENFVNLFDSRAKTGDCHVSVTDSKSPLACHKAILAGLSASMKNLVVGDALGRKGTVRAGPAQLALPISGGAFEYLLRFAYYGFVEVPSLYCSELIAFCIRNQIPVLRSNCERILLREAALDAAIAAVMLCQEAADPNSKKSTPLVTDKDFTSKVRNLYYPFIAANLSKLDFGPLRKGSSWRAVVVDILQAYQKAKGSSPKPKKDAKPEPKESSSSSEESSHSGDKDPEPPEKKEKKDTAKDSESEKKKDRKKEDEGAGTEDSDGKQKRSKKTKKDEGKSPKKGDEPVIVKLEELQ